MMTQEEFMYVVALRRQGQCAKRTPAHMPSILISHGAMNELDNAA